MNPLKRLYTRAKWGGNWSPFHTAMFLPIWDMVQATVQRLIEGRAVDLVFQANRCGASGLDIETLLREQGVYTWGHHVDLIGRDPKIYLTIKRKQERWAMYLLARAGIKTAAETEGQPDTSLDAARAQGRAQADPYHLESWGGTDARNHAA